MNPYLWKCWREYGKVALGLLVLFVALAWVGDHLALSQVKEEFARLSAQDFGASAHPSQLVHGFGGLDVPRQMLIFTGVLYELREMNIDLLVLGGLLAAIFIGSMGSLAREFDGKTAELLFTSPQSRARLLWTNWLCGIAAMEGCLLLTGILSWIYCAIPLRAITYEVSYDHVRYRWILVVGAELLRILLAMLPVNALLYSIATLGGVAFRGASKGTLAAAICLGLYGFFYYYLSVRWHMDTPSWWIDKLIVGIAGGRGHLPMGLFALWSALTLTLPLAAQKILERRDV